MTQQYDLVVLGGGPAGYTAAKRASQLGMKVALVEKESLGGTCLHKGCIPTKSFLKSAEIITMMKNARQYGISSVDPEFDFADIRARKDKVVDHMFHGIEQLMKAHQITVYKGKGRLLGSSIFSPQAGTVSVEYENGDSVLLVNQHVLICTGSRPKELPFLPFDHKTILSSDDMMELSQLPESIIIIGGGVIGLEFASLLIDMGVAVTVIEAAKMLLPQEEQAVSRKLKTALEQRGVKFILGADLDAEHIHIAEDHVEFELPEKIQAKKVLVAVGRTANIDDIGLNNTNVRVENGLIVVNKYYQTDESHIYAAGDIIGGLQLAHTASREAVIAIEHMNGEQPIALDNLKVPRCIYTSPEVASIGLSKRAAEAAGYSVTAQSLSFTINGKAVISGSDNGYATIVKDNHSDEILGISLIGSQVTELINEASLAMFMNASTSELGLAVHAHPSISEVLMELGLGLEG